MEIEYQIVAPERFEEVTKLFDDHFLTDEPTTMNLHSASDTDKFSEMIRDFLKQGLSWCAVDKNTGKMVGVRISYSQSIADAPDSPPTSDEYVKAGWSRHLSKVLAMLDLMVDAKKIMMTHNETRMLGMFAVGVHRDYRKKGIATELVRRTLDHAKTLGITLSAVTCSNIYSQRLFEKLGFEKIREETYESYVDATTGVKVFKDIDRTHPSVISYVKRL